MEGQEKAGGETAFPPFPSAHPLPLLPAGRTLNRKKGGLKHLYNSLWDLGTPILYGIYPQPIVAMREQHSNFEYTLRPLVWCG